MLKRLSITVWGRVQGVGFRYSARTMANYIGVKGLIKNRSDGSVYIEAEGNAEQLDEFVKWCRRGPDHARITDVFVNEISLKNDTSFEVGY
jgi:acylphosphatase